MISLRTASSLYLRIGLVFAALLASISIGFAQVVSGFTVSPTSVIGGLTVTGTVKLSSPAKAGGMTVPLFSNDVAGITPVWVVFPEGSRIQSFTVGSRPVIASTPVTLSATGGGVTKTTVLTVLPTTVLKVTLDPTSVKAGVSSTATVTLVGPAPKDGALVQLSSDSAAATLPAELLIPEGQSEGQVTVNTVGVPNSGYAKITAAFGVGSASANLRIFAAVLRELSILAPSVFGGDTIKGQVVLDGPAPLFGQKVPLVGDVAEAKVPDFVLVPSGATTAIFDIPTDKVTEDKPVTVSAVGTKRTAKFTILPLFSSFTFTPSTVIGSASSTGQITILKPAPKGGIKFTLQSDASTVKVPESVTIPEGGFSTSFTATTVALLDDVNAGITAISPETTRVAILKVLSPRVVGLTLTPATLTGGAKTEAVLTIDGPAPVGGLPVAMSTNSVAVIPPATVTVEEGKFTVKFDILTTSVTSDGSVEVTATVSGGSKVTKMRVLAPILSELGFSPNFAIGGTVGTGVITLTGPAAAGGYTVNLYSNKTQATVPATLTLPAGITTMTFPITTTVVTVDVVATIAAVGGTTKKGSFVVKTGPPIAVSAWPKFRGNPDNTGAGKGTGAVGTLKWAFEVNESIYSSAAIGQDGTIYVGADDDTPGLEAFNANGTRKWSFNTDGWVYSSPAITSTGRVYVGSENNLFAVSSTGQMIWKFVTGGFVLSSPAIGPDGTIYVGSYDRNLYAVNPNGTRRWAFLTRDRIYSSPAVGADGTIYVGSGDGSLYAINPNGTKKWEFVTGGGVSSSPAIGPDGVIYVGSTDGSLYAINADGTRKWAYATPGKIESSPALAADGTVYVGSGNGLYAVTPAGKRKWMYLTRGLVTSSPAIAMDGTVYVGSQDGKLFALKPNGELSWSFTTQAPIHGSPIIGADGTVYIGSTDAKFYAIK